LIKPKIKVSYNILKKPVFMMGFFIDGFPTSSLGSAKRATNLSQDHQ
jgi:hypothetical protein